MKVERKTRHRLIGMGLVIAIGGAIFFIISLQYAAELLSIRNLMSLRGLQSNKIDEIENLSYKIAGKYGQTVQSILRIIVILSPYYGIDETIKNIHIIAQSKIVLDAVDDAISPENPRRFDDLIDEMKTPEFVRLMDNHEFSKIINAITREEIAHGKLLSVEEIRQLR